MPPWLFNVHMDSENIDQRFEQNQLYFQITALVVDSNEKLCCLVSVFVRACKRRKLPLNVGKSKVLSLSKYVNVDRMN